MRLEQGERNAQGRRGIGKRYRPEEVRDFVEGRGVWGEKRNEKDQEYVGKKSCRRSDKVGGGG